jgi:hypothetical protein
MRAIAIIFLLLLSGGANAQFAPQVGRQGTTAMHKDSSAFVNWAQTCKVTRGYQNVANPALGYPTVGDSSMAIGKAGTNGVVSLGDGGMAVLSFYPPVENGNGYDFAVFENGFQFIADSGYAFLEFAFVEVSSDGQYFVRFPAVSNIDTSVQCDPYGISDASKVDQLAGKYVFPYGTPFDLELLKDTPGLDVNRITHIRLVDVVGSIDAPYAQRDSRGVIINDPWPTDFPNCGFDVDAIGVIHQNAPNGEDAASAPALMMYPNSAAVSDVVHLRLPHPHAPARVQVYNLQGQLRSEQWLRSAEDGWLASTVGRGIYLVSVEQQGIVYRCKWMVR